MLRQPPPTSSMACSFPPSPGKLELPAPVFTSRDCPARCSPAPATSCKLSRSRSCSRRAVPSTPSSGPAATLSAVKGSPITNPPLPHRPQPSVASDPPTTYATMVGSTAAPPPSPHRDCPTEILNGDVVTKNEGHESIEEVATAATLCALYPVTQDPQQGCGVSGEKPRLEWGLTTKIFSITLDNASNNNSCVGFLKSNLLGKSLLPCKGDLLHGRCASHVINIMVQDALEVTCKAVDNIRESIKFVRSSPTRKQKFREIVAQEGITCRKNLSLDVVTRWNSTHLMIKTALEYRRAFAAMKSQDTSFTCLPTNVEWETTESVCIFLEVFLNATMVVSGTLYPSAHLYFHELWKIHLTLQRAAEHTDVVIKSMAEAMQKKFIKYWKLSHLTICLPVILDPRYKFKILEFCLKSGLGSEATRYLAKVKRTFKDLFVEYSVHEGDSDMRNGQGTNNVDTSIDNPWDQWNQHVKQHQQNRAKLSELDIYLKDDVCPQEDGFDILCWWSANAHKYPIVSRIAKDVLAAPASTVASESAFSTGGRILSDYRSRMLETTTEALICLQDWLRPRGTKPLNTIINDVIYGAVPILTHIDWKIRLVTLFRRILPMAGRRRLPRRRRRRRSDEMLKTASGFCCYQVLVSEFLCWPSQTPCLIHDILICMICYVDFYSSSGNLAAL